MAKPSNLYPLSPAEVISPRTNANERAIAARPRSGVRFALVLLPVLLLAFAVRAVRLQPNDLSLDEAISFFIASKTPINIVLYTLNAIWEHPPGYYLLLHFWMQLAGQTEWSLRALSSLGGTLSTALVATLALRWFNRRVATLAALVTAMQPLMVYFGSNARMYAWLYAVSLLGVYLFDRALTANRWRDWLAFIAVTLLGMVLHYLAGMAILAYVVFVIIRWRQIGSGGRRFLGILVALAGLVILWVAFAPGLKASLLTQIQRALANPWTPYRLSTIYIEWALGSAMEDLSRAEVLIRSILPWLLFYIGVLAMPEPRRWKRRDLQVLILGLALIPPLVGSFLFAIVASRHHSSMLGIFAFGSALGIDALFKRQRVIGAIALVLLVGLDAVHVRGQITGGWQPYSTPMNYIAERAQAGERIITTYFFDWPLDQYYNRRHLPSSAIPASEGAISVTEAGTQAAQVVKENPSFWLMLYPSVAHPERVEQAFNQQAFPADKVWFPSTRGVVHFYGPQPLSEGTAGQTWENFRLVRWQHSTAAVAAGDAIRLQFEWQRVATPPRALVALRLEGPDGNIWASRVSEPCNGTCITSEWPSSGIVDRAAFAVPADIPPGDYELQIAWLTPEGKPLLGRQGADDTQQVDLPLLDVHVLPPSARGLAAPPAGELKRVSFGGGLTLYSASVVSEAQRAGSTLPLVVQWEVSERQPELSGHLHLVRNGADFTASQALGPDWYPSATWQPGRIILTEPRFLLPGNLAPGVYQASLSIAGPDGVERPARVALGTLTIEDRPHRFDLPADGVAVETSWSENIRLMRANVPAGASAGNNVPLALVWQAGAPADRSWKVFIHLLAADGKTVAQVDGYPADGQALTSTWQPGEVVVDTHSLALPKNLAPGSYRVELGLYDENTNERLARPDGSNSLTLPTPLVVTR